MHNSYHSSLCDVSIRDQFPLLLKPTTTGKPFVFLDTAASAQKPRVVIDAIQKFYSEDYANVHRGLYALTVRATAYYEDTRDRVQHFIHAAHREEIIFTSGATAAINLVARSFGDTYLRAGDEILVSVMEHHSNIVPWQMLCQRRGAMLKIIPLAADGALDLNVYAAQLTPKTKLVAITHVSNVLGNMNPIAEMIALAHAQYDIPVLIDGVQATARLPVDVQALDCDFYVFSAHKMYGPTGVGVLYGKKRWLNQMPPDNGGGDMIRQVQWDKTEYAALPYKFEAGTPNIAGVVGFGAALDFIESIGFPAIVEAESHLTRYAFAALQKIPGLTLYGDKTQHIGVMSFTMEQAHPHDIGTIVDAEGIAIRAGHHCAMPLMDYFQVPAMARISFGVYNTRADVDALIASLSTVIDIFGER